MPQLIPAGQPGAITDDLFQEDAQKQLGLAVDMLRMLAGNASVGASDIELRDPVNNKYQIYVDPAIGRDTFVGGSYAEADNGTRYDKDRRIENQQLARGYTPFMPFRTPNRAMLEVALITSKKFLTLKGICGGLVSVNFAPGVYDVLNHPASYGNPVKRWDDGYEPTEADLIGFNPPGGGLIVPRGTSLCSYDLRKCGFFPAFVPPTTDVVRTYDMATGQVSINGKHQTFLLTGGCYAFGFTFYDNQQVQRSHHMLSAFGAASYAGA